jgi:hypothetical protein
MQRSAEKHFQEWSARIPGLKRETWATRFVTWSFLCQLAAGDPQFHGPFLEMFSIRALHSEE